jgi:hypothetical protein
MSEAKAEAERTRRAAQRQVDELTRQRDSITGHLDQLRHLLGAMSVPGLAQLNAAVQPPAVEAAAKTDDEPADKTITLPTQPETARR